MTRADFIAFLKRRWACKEAIAWVEATPGTVKDIWSACTRYDWMCWLLRQLHGYAAPGDTVISKIYKNSLSDQERVDIARTIPWEEIETKLLALGQSKQ